MAEMLLTIESNGKVFSPPVTDGVQIEWEISGVAGKLTFTTIKVPTGGMSFNEGDKVQFYYDNKLVFVGYVFTKKRDKDHHIKVTCYDQLRYFKNKFTYVFENKRADEIVKSLCNDFGMSVGTLDNTQYVIPAIAEENTTAYDIILKVLDDTLTNTGNMFVLYDDAGKITVRDAGNMTSKVLIDSETAENFDYSSSIDEETYNSVVLYYKDKDNKIVPYTASSKFHIQQWGVLRYFEEIKIPSIAQNKADALLKLYCRKTRSLAVKGAFGAVDVRAGCLIPVQLNLGDIVTNNYMLVQKVTHKFNQDHYTMDLTLEGAWE